MRVSRVWRWRSSRPLANKCQRISRSPLLHLFLFWKFASRVSDWHAFEFSNSKVRCWQVVTTAECHIDVKDESGVNETCLPQEAKMTAEDDRIVRYLLACHAWWLSWSSSFLINQGGCWNWFIDFIELLVLLLCAYVIFVPLFFFYAFEYFCLLSW